MATANIYNINPKGDKGPRNAFDLGYSCLYTSPCGEILPAYVEEVKRGDRLKLNMTSVVRTNPVNTSAYMAFDEVVQFYAVPKRLIWSDYNYWIISNQLGRSTLNVPDVGLQNLLPHCSWSDIGRFFSATHSPASLTLPGVPTEASALRLLDMLNYGLPPIPAITENLKSTVAPQSTMKNLLKGYFDSIDSAGLKCNYFRLAAFQCIYMFAFRNEEYEKLDPSYYNVDNLFLTSSRVKVNNTAYTEAIEFSTPTHLEVEDGQELGRICLNKLFTPRYKNWRDDLFTSAKPYNGFAMNAPLSNGDSGTDFDWSSIQGFDNPTGKLPQSPFYTEDDGHFYPNSFIFLDKYKWSDNSTDTMLYAQNIRVLMSQDKFIRKTIYADKNYKSQMAALFGVDVEEPDVPRYLGSFKNTVSISDVVATSAGNSMTEEQGDGTPNASSVLGEIAGKGYGQSNDFVFDETFSEDSIIIGMHYIVPRNNYDSYRLNRFNTKVSRWDYYFPDFDGLGLQPIFKFERNLSNPMNLTPEVALDVTSVIGFGPRFAEYKCRQSETHGTFAAEQPDDNWTLSNNQFGIGTAGDFANFKILPQITDRIFTLQYNGSQASDPFKCYHEFQVTKISNMEQFGVPSF